MIKVLKETADYLVIDKPYGMVVNRAESVKDVLTVQDWVEGLEWYHRPETSRDDFKTKVYRERSGICHRLDKETSGCLLVAKNPDSLVYFLSLFKKRTVIKEYLALVHGKVDPSKGEIVLPIRRSVFEREKWHVHYDGKRAVSNWEVVDRFDFVTANIRWQNSLSLLRVGLKTGRTHQIRVHFSFLGWPLFSDDKYLNKEQARIDRDLLSRHFLHAHLLSFVDPSGQNVLVNSELSEDCANLLEKLRRR